MASRFLRICTYPGCTNVQQGPRCDKHPYPPQPDRRESAAQRGYDHRWRELRKVKLVDSPICELKKRCDGRPAVLVDHIKPISQGGDALDWGNLQSLCRKCHDWKTLYVDRRKQCPPDGYRSP